MRAEEATYTFADPWDAREDLVVGIEERGQAVMFEKRLAGGVEGGQVGVRIVDARGGLVRSLGGQHLGTGRGEVVWDGRNEAGRLVACGRYYCRAVSAWKDLAIPITRIR